MKVEKEIVPSAKKKSAYPAETFSFSIDAYSPETIPMFRLGEYMAELAKMIGEKESVHFEKLVKGSTVLQHLVEFEAVPKVRDRLTDLKRGLADGEAAKHFSNINKMLKADNAVGNYCQAGKSAVILNFPGREAITQDKIVTKQRGSIQGTVTRVGGADDTAHVQIVSGEQKIGGCITTREIARELGKLLYQDVRLHGSGKWHRDEDGLWAVEEFRIEAFEHLQSDELEAAIKDLRALEVGWQEGALERIKSMGGN